jgi:predicted transcriptional regulator
MSKDKLLNQIFSDIFKSRVKARVYTFLLRKKCATSKEIAEYTNFYPSTVREALSEMFEQNLVYRKKLKKDSKGKNPYIYYPSSPIEILRGYIKDIEDKFNRINRGSRRLHIKIEMGKGDQS